MRTDPLAPHPGPHPSRRFDAPHRPMDPHAARRRYRRGETLQHAGDGGDVLRIEHGLVKLVVPAFDGRDRILAVLGAGDLLGAEAALTGHAIVADAVALGAVTVVACDRAAFLAELRTDPDRAVAVARSVATRLGAAWDDQARAYRPVLERLAAVMLDLARRFGEPTHDGRWVLNCGLNHHALAALIGAQRASVSVAMAEFRAARAAVGARGAYTIDLQRLQALAGEAASVGPSCDPQATAATPTRLRPVAAAYRPVSRTTASITGSRSTVSSTSVVVNG